MRAIDEMHIAVVCRGLSNVGPPAQSSVLYNSLWLIITAMTLSNRSVLDGIRVPNNVSPCVHVLYSPRWVSHQLLEGGLVQVALQGEVTEAFPRWLVGLHLHGVSLHGAVVADGTACHQRRSCQALQVLHATVYIHKSVKLLKYTICSL